MQIREYQKPSSLDEAYSLLIKHRSNRILGGCTFLKRTRLNINIGIDLENCNLSYINESDEEITIGSYTCLREVEISHCILANFGDMVAKPLSHLIGVQLRNAITIGGHVASRYGFSDLIPALLALNARLRFFNGPERSLWAYMQESRPDKDILTEIILPKQNRRGEIQMLRFSHSDYSVFCLAVSRVEQDWIVAGGVFPGRAKLALHVMSKMRMQPVKKNDAALIANEIVEEFNFGTNSRASADYRKELCRAFSKRAIEELADEN
jgi:CO/xanthine dehydrogenase FAD-binding subunit